MGVDDGNGVGQFVSDMMVVGNDHIHAQTFCVRRFVYGVDAVVHGDNQLRTLRMQTVDNRLGQTVSLGTVGEHIEKVRFTQCQITAQKRRSRHAVCVVVAENGDTLEILDCIVDTLDGSVHILVGKGVGQCRLVIVEKGLHLCIGTNSSGDRQQSGEGIQTVLLCEVCG